MINKNKEKKTDVWSFGLVSSTRIETLVDGVLAIALTLLVLELSANKHVVEVISTGQYTEIYTELMGYILGFLVIGIYWVLHHFMFHFIKRSDGIIVWINILFLMFAALVPLSTKVNNMKPSSNATIFYFATAVVSVLLLLLMWVYAIRGYRLVDKDLDQRTIKFVNRTILIGTFIFIISLIGQYLINPNLGYFGFVALVYMIIATAYGDHIPFSRRQK